MVGTGAQGNLVSDHGVLLGGHTKHVVGVVTDLLHVILVGDDAVVDGVLQSQDALFALGLITHVVVLWPMPTTMPWCQGTCHDGGEDSLGSIVGCEARLVHVY